jgi:hypothetical protein
MCKFEQINQKKFQIITTQISLLVVYIYKGRITKSTLKP